MAFAYWPILEMLSFLEYVVFLGAIFLHRTTVNDL